MKEGPPIPVSLRSLATVEGSTSEAFHSTPTHHWQPNERRLLTGLQRTHQELAVAVFTTTRRTKE